MYKSILLISLPLLLTGCGSLSGYDAGDHYACAAPEGVSCMSMSGVYANLQAGNIPGTKSTPVTSDSTPAAVREITGRIDHAAISSGTPLRTQPRQLRAWLAPWPDADGDIHDQSYIYMVVDTGRWQMERVRNEIVQQFSPNAEPSIKPIGITPVTGAAVKPGDTKSEPLKPTTNGISSLPNFNEMMKKVGVSNGNP